MSDSLVLRPRSAGEIIDAAIQLIRQGWREMFVVALALMVPTLLVTILAAMAGVDMSTGLTAAALAVMVFSIFWTAVVMGGLIIAAGELYVHGRTLPVADTLRAGLRRMGPVLVAYLLFSLAVALGFLLFIVPGFMAIGALGLAVPIAAIENVDGARALSRSFEITKGLRWHVLKVLVLMTLLVMVVFIPAILVIAPLSLGGRVVLPEIISTIISAAIYPLFAAGVAVLYYDVRIRKEGFDIEHLAASLSPAASPAVESPLS